MFYITQLSLLCGAPGLGKTTLAHIIAHHAGYHVVEMNARLDMNIVQQVIILCKDRERERESELL